MFLQSGVIPYQRQAGEIRILLVSSSSGKYWVIPKGWRTPWLTSAQSAAKEAWEEAGVVGTMKTPTIGHYHTQKWGVWLPVEVFLLEVTQEFVDYPEAKVRQRRWLSPTEAIKQIRHDDLKQLLNGLDYPSLLKW